MSAREEIGYVWQPTPQPGEIWENRRTWERREPDNNVPPGGLRVEVISVNEAQNQVTIRNKMGAVVPMNLRSFMEAMQPATELRN